MNLTWILLGVIVALIGGLIWASKRWGGSETEADNAEQNNEQMEQDAEIASRPWVDDPFGGMRRKK